jgi:hypothetical protein
MGGKTAIVLYVFVMVAVIVGVDVLFFRHHAWERLMVNVGVVLVFGAFYLRFLKRPLAPDRYLHQPSARSGHTRPVWL